MTRIGIYGGTFSPPHRAHLEAAKAFMEQMWLDFLYIIPTSASPDPDKTITANAKDRLEMCRLAFSEIEGIYVSDMEIRRGGASYTVQTLRELTGEDRRLFLLCGTDMMLSLGNWKDAEEIFSLCYPTYIRRENDPIITARITAANADYQKRFGKIVRRIVTEPLELSSSQIRQRIQRGASISDMVPPAVEKYILDKHLYISLQNGEEEQ